jgi:sugar-specific transcriptional regulator TrmB
MQTAISKLQQLGFSEYEARAYTALVNENPLTAYEISKNTGIPSSKIYEVIRKLEFRHMIQSVHGERSKIFIPVPPDEFVQNFRSSTDDNLHAIQIELNSFRGGMNANYTWHINNYDTLLLKSKRMIDTARESILLLTWPEEMGALFDDLKKAKQRDVKIAVIHYGKTDFKIVQLYVHPLEDTIYAEKDIRGFTIVADSQEAINGKIARKNTEAIWSMNQGFVNMAEDYIRHDIYLMKIMKRFYPVLRKKFGDRYERLRNVYMDEAF